MGKSYDWSIKNWCTCGGPTGKVRVRMDHHRKDDCTSWPAQAFYCEPNAYQTVSTGTPKLSAYGDAMRNYMKSLWYIMLDLDIMGEYRLN